MNDTDHEPPRSAFCDGVTMGMLELAEGKLREVQSALSLTEDPMQMRNLTEIAMSLREQIRHLEQG